MARLEDTHMHKERLRLLPSRLHPEIRRNARLLNMPEEPTAWDIYNEQARLIDTERIRDWVDTLNTLLIFAALFSAVVTAFIIESMKLIQEDSSDSTRNILLVITQQLANTSTAPFHTTPFDPPHWAIKVNYCLFFSLFCGLVTSVTAVLALQWVGNYDRSLNPSSAEERALQRHFRDEGARHWKMEPIIAFLPTVIFISLFVFFVGMAYWLWHVHLGMAGVAIGALSIGAFFYWITTTISIASISAPFRTPISRALPLVNGRIIHSFSLTIKSLDPRHISGFSSGLLEVIRNIGNALRGVKYRQRGLKAIKTFKQLLGSFYSLKTFEARELEAVKSSQDLKRDSLFWLARSISIGPYQRSNLQIIVKAILELPSSPLPLDKRNIAPWASIFRVLYEPYIQRRERVTYSDEDQNDVILCLRSLVSIGQVVYTTEEFQDLFRDIYQDFPSLDTMCDILTTWGEHKDILAGDLDSHKLTVIESYKHCILQWRQCPLEFSVLVLENIAKPYSETSLPSISDILEPIHEGLHIDLCDLTTSTTIPPCILDLILHIIVNAQDSKSFLDQDPSLSYLSSVKGLLELSKGTSEASKDGPKEEIQHLWRAHAAIFQQIAASFSQIDDVDPGDSIDTHHQLITLLNFVRSPAWSRISLVSESFVLFSMAETGLDLWNEQNRLFSATLLASVLPTHWTFTSDNWANWWVQIILGFGDLLELEEELGNTTVPPIQEIVLDNASRILQAELPGRSGFTQEQIKKLDGIRNDFVRLFASVVMHSGEIVQILSKVAKDVSFDQYQPFVDNCYNYYIKNSVPDIGFLRAFTIMGSPSLYHRMYDGGISAFKESQLRDYFSWRVLWTIFKFDISEADLVISTLELLCNYEWFSAAFLKAEGPNWLATFVLKSPYRFHRVLRIIRDAFAHSRAYTHALQWLHCTRHCLISADLGANLPEDADRKLYRSLMADDGKRLEDEICKRTQEYQARMENDMDSQVNDGVSSTLHTVNKTTIIRHRIPEIIENIDESIEESPNLLMEWTAEHWREWQELSDEVVQGLSRGWIEANAEQPEAWKTLAISVVNSRRNSINEMRPDV